MLQTNQPPKRPRRRRQTPLRRWSRRIVSSPAFALVAGKLAAAYLRLVRYSSRYVIDPPDAYARVEPHLPVIVGMWHGEHFMAPFLRRPHDRGSVLISRHGDGAINAVAARSLGIDVIRGSGGRSRSRKATVEKGGISGFLTMRRTLARGITVALTADISRGESRRASNGIVALARASGRPIMPVAFATSNRIRFRSWDRAALSLPFGRMACVMGPLIEVPADADEETMEAKRLEVENGLNAVTARAYAIVDRRDV